MMNLLELRGSMTVCAATRIMINYVDLPISQTQSTNVAINKHLIYYACIYWLCANERSSISLALVKAAKGCLGKEDQPFPLELIPCLDFSFGSDQVLKLSMHSSIFGNAELCR